MVNQMDKGSLAFRSDRSSGMSWREVKRVKERLTTGCDDTC